MRLSALASKIELEFSDIRKLEQVTGLVQHYGKISKYVQFLAKNRKESLQEGKSVLNGKPCPKRFKKLHGFREKIRIEFTEVGMTDIVDEIANIDELVQEYVDIYEYVKNTARKKRKELKENC